MTYTTHNQDDSIDTKGTCLKGYVTATYEELVNMFGPPQTPVDAYCVDVEWNIQFEDGVVGTIYNWKNGPNFLGKDACPIEDMEVWCVGGRKMEALYRIELMMTPK